MPFFEPLVAPRQLPALHSSIEHAVMDWKAVDTSTAFHKAKDVAAFANHLGGTLIIGASEVSGQLDAYIGMTPADAAKVRDGFSKAVEQRCQPHPVFDFAPYPHPDDPTKEIVVVNVWPSLLLVGVKLEAHKPTEGYGGKTFAYPVRAGTDADYLEPSQLAMYMTPHVRRVAVLLSKIPKGTIIMIKSPAGFDYGEYSARLDEVREMDNIVTFLTPDGTKKMRNIPLDRITTVYEDWQNDRQANVWRMNVEFWNVPSPPARVT